MMKKIIHYPEKFIVASISIEKVKELFLNQIINSIKPVFVDQNNSPEIFNFFSKHDVYILNNFKTFKRQKEWLSGRYLIKQLVSQILFINPLQVIIDVKPEGAPFLKYNQGLNISISHSGKYAIGAVGLDKNLKIGIDIEKKHVSRSDTFSKIAFSDKELKSMQDQSFHQLYVNWTIKEAYLKFIEKGFHENLKEVEVIGNKIYHKGEEMKQINIHTNVLDNDYIYSVVYN